MKEWEIKIAIIAYELKYFVGSRLLHYVSDDKALCGADVTQERKRLSKVYPLCGDCAAALENRWRNQVMIEIRNVWQSRATPLMQMIDQVKIRKPKKEKWVQLEMNI